MWIPGLLLTAFLLAFNAFFALAEFAVVRVRSTRVAELARDGDPRALALARIHANLDEFLSVVQVGITCAGIGLGLVLDQGLARLVARLAPEGGLGARLAGLGVAFVVGTYLSVVLGELVPKAVALRDPERMALRCAIPLRFFQRLFWLPLKVLAWSAKAVLRVLGREDAPEEAPHTENELRDLLEASQEGGVMSFRRLLMVENVFDLGALRVLDAMRPRDQARSLRVGASEEEVVAFVREHRYSRYPLVDPAAASDALPVGVLHVKDLLVRDRGVPLDLRAIARAYLTFRADAPLEQALVEFQRSHRHLAMVRGDDGTWRGILALEDVLEDVIGQIHDEFEREPMELEDAMLSSRVLVDVDARGMDDLLPLLLHAVPAALLPEGTDRAPILKALLERERTMSTYAGHGLAIPHARVAGLSRPILVFARLREGLAVPGRAERMDLAFLLLTSAGDPRTHIRLLSRIASLVESDYVMERLRAASSEAEVAEVLTTGSRVQSS